MWLVLALVSYAIVLVVLRPIFYPVAADRTAPKPFRQKMHPFSTEVQHKPHSLYVDSMHDGFKKEMPLITGKSINDGQVDMDMGNSASIKRKRGDSSWVFASEVVEPELYHVREYASFVHPYSYKREGDGISSDTFLTSGGGVSIGRGVTEDRSMPVAYHLI